MPRHGEIQNATETAAGSVGAARSQNPVTRYWFHARVDSACRHQQKVRGSIRTGDDTQMFEMGYISNLHGERAHAAVR